MAEQEHDTTVTLFVARYPSVETAMEDFDFIRADRSESFITVFDAAVVEREPDTSVHVVRKIESPTRVGGWAGFLAGAAVSAVFPPALLAVSAGAALGAIAGHFARGMSREDIKDIGELLSDSEAALVVVISTPHAEQVRGRMGRAEVVESREVRSSAREIDLALDDVAAQVPEQTPPGSGDAPTS